MSKKARSMNQMPFPKPGMDNFRKADAPLIWVPNQKGREPEQNFNEIYPWDSDSTKQAKVEAWIAQNVGEHLQRTFPNREWGVGVDSRGGMIIIKCESVSLTHGYHIKMNQMNIHDLAKAAVEAGAEILERYGVTRDKKFNPDSIEAAARDAKGNVIGRV